MVQLQRAVPGDLESILSLSSRTEEVQSVHSLLNTALKSGGLYLIKQAEDLVGYISSRVVLSEAELDQIVVHPAFQKRGIAQQALTLWHQQLTTQQVEQVFLEVREGNAAAIGLYKSLGYIETGRRKNYYLIAGEHFDALLMAHSLRDF